MHRLGVTVFPTRSAAEFLKNRVGIMHSRFFHAKTLENTGFLEKMVEVGGVEPPSESALQGDSPGADGDLHSLTQAPRRQAQGFGSFMVHGAGKAYRTHVPH